MEFELLRDEKGEDHKKNKHLIKMSEKEKQLKEIKEDQELRSQT